MGRLFGIYVASSLESIEDHIRRHGLNVSPPEYLKIGDFLTQGREGIFSGVYDGNPYTAVVRGRVCRPSPDGSTKIFGLLRSIRRGM